jgi:tetratricopeptide (TPR) repeat protein
LKQRGLHGVRLVISDKRLGLVEAAANGIITLPGEVTRVAMLYARLGFRYHRRVMNPVFPPPARRVRHLYMRQLAALLLAVGVGLSGVAPAAYQDEGIELKAARQAIERREFTKALDLLAKALKVSPENADLHFLMARTARRAAAFKEAQHHIDECVRLKGSAEAIALERKILQAQVGELDDVEKPLQALVKKGHTDAGLILEALSQVYIELFRLEDAMRCLNHWLDLKPKEIQALLWRAKVMGMMPEEGKNDGTWTMYYFDANPKGLPDYQTVVAIDPEQDEARLQVAQAMLQLSGPEKALEHFQYLHKRKYKNSVVLLGLARCRGLLGEVKEAEELLDKLLRDDPRNSQALMERGKLALGAGETADAEKWLRKALTLDSFDYHSNYFLYLCLTQVGKTEQAKECSAKLERIQKDRVRMNDLYTKVLKAPRDLRPRYELGRIFLQQNRESEGLRLLGSVLKAEPGHKQSHLALAEYYSRAGKKDLAQKHRELAGETGKGKKEPK